MKKLRLDPDTPIEAMRAMLADVLETTDEEALRLWKDVGSDPQTTRMLLWFILKTYVDLSELRDVTLQFATAITKAVAAPHGIEAPKGPPG